MPNDKITPNCALKVGLWKKHRFETTSTRPSTTSTTAEKHHHRERCIAKTRANAGGERHAPAGDTKTKEIRVVIFIFFCFFSWVQIPL